MEIKVQSLYGGINASLALIVEEKDTEEDDDKDSHTPVNPPDSSVQIPSHDSTDPTGQPTDSVTEGTVDEANNSSLVTGSAEKSDNGNDLAVGESVADVTSNAIYRIIVNTDNNRTVEYVKPVNKTAKVTIPSTVMIQGTNYQVTAIANKAFKNNKKVKKVVIPSTVKKIGKQAFFNCKKLKNIVIKTKKLKNNSVGKKAFKGISAKAVIKVPKVKRAMYQKILGKKGIGNKNKIK